MAVNHNIRIDKGSYHVERFTLDWLQNPQLPFNATTNPYVPVPASSFTWSLKASSNHLTKHNIALSSQTGDITVTGNVVSVIFKTGTTSALQFSKHELELEYTLELTGLEVDQTLRVCEGTLTITNNIN